MTEMKNMTSFVRAYSDLKSGLRAGRWPVGSRLNIVDFASATKVSPTPVREAMARLAGEGLLEDRLGQGYFIPQLGPVELSELYWLCQAIVVLALSDGTARRREDPRSPNDTGYDHIRSSGGVLMAVAAQSANRLLGELANNIDHRLAPIARAELAVMAGKGAADDPPRDLLPPDRPLLSRRLLAFFAKRRKAAFEIVQMQQSLQAENI